MKNFFEKWGKTISFILFVFSLLDWFFFNVSPEIYTYLVALGVTIVLFGLGFYGLFSKNHRRNNDLK